MPTEVDIQESAALRWRVRPPSHQLMRDQGQNDAGSGRVKRVNQTDLAVIH